MDLKSYSDLTDIITFIYDGECPFCNHFALLTELKGGLNKIQIVDGRLHIELLRELESIGYSFNNGAILIVNGNIYHGANAISKICSIIKPSHSLLNFISAIFRSKQTTKISYPFLLLARRVALFTKGKPITPI